MNDCYYYCACSFGKDSIATILLALKHGEPLDEVVFAEVMFDAGRDISGEHPAHIQWIREQAKPRLEAMGLKVTILRNSDFVTNFHKRIFKSKCQERNGKIRAFPLANRCYVLRECKLKPVHDYIKSLKRAHKHVIQYVGIAADEIDRLNRKNMNGKVSLLAKYGYTEKMAYELCRESGFLSPIYQNSARGGCWFCPNQKIRQFASLRIEYPELWSELKELSLAPDMVSKMFRYTQTFEQVEKQVLFHSKQLELF